MPSPDEMEELKFHWKKWKDESRAFWGRAILGTAILLFSVLFQLGVLSIAIPGVSLHTVAYPKLFLGMMNGLSWLLLLFLLFKFVDLLRHRVPEALEHRVHNNVLPNPFRKFYRREDVDLKRFGRFLYLVFVAYIVSGAILLGVALVHILLARSDDLRHQLSTPEKVQEKGPARGL